MRRIYLDSCIVIYLIEGPDNLSQTIRSSLQPGAAEQPSLCVSDLTRLECRVLPIKKGDQDLLRQFDDFFASRDLQIFPLERKVLDLATELRAAHGTKTPDAIHLAAAIVGDCSEFWTNDPRLKRAAAGKIELRILP